MSDITPTDAQRLEEIRQRLTVLRQCRLNILVDDFEFLLTIIDRQNAVVEAAVAFRNARSAKGDGHDPFEIAIAARDLTRALDALEPKP